MLDSKCDNCPFSPPPKHLLEIMHADNFTAVVQLVYKFGGRAKTLVTWWEFPDNDTQSLFRFCVLAHQEGLNPLSNGCTFLGEGVILPTVWFGGPPLPGLTIKRPAGMHLLSTNPCFGRKEMTRAVPAVSHVIRVFRISSHCPRHFFLPPTHFPPSNLSEELGSPPQSEEKKKKFRLFPEDKNKRWMNEELICCCFCRNAACEGEFIYY